MRVAFRAGLLASVALAAASAPALAETRVGARVDITAPVAENLYAGGASVLLAGPVDGDAVLIGGTVLLTGDVVSDAALAGGTVEVDGVIGDDLRAVGGTVSIRGLVTDQAILAGGTVTVGAESAIAGRTWIAANEASVLGQLGGNLRVRASRVSIAGRIEGSVDVTGREVRIEPGAIIAGDLVWHGSTPPEIAEDAQILGAVIGDDDPAPDTATPLLGSTNGAGPAASALSVAAVFLAAALLWRLFPQFIERAGGRLQAAPGRTLLAGGIAFIALPVLIIVLFVTVVGWLVGLVVLAGYGLGLAGAGLLALVALAEVIVRRQGGNATWMRRLLVLLLLAIGATLAGTVPWVGGLLVPLLWCLGLGLMVRAVFGAARGEAV